MKSNKTVIAAIVLFMAGLAAFYFIKNRTPFSEERPAVGEAAPSISLADLSGTMLKLADYRGKIVLVNFWASWCPPCKDEMPGFEKVYEAYENKGFAVVGIALDDVPLSLLRELKITYPVAKINERVTRDYGNISGVPASFLIGRDGIIIKKHKGFYPENELREDMEKAFRIKG